ncbi:hypothetical protein [Burkholderia cenocepacia]|uniref:hypothetical protein n=1 Tax=Burkholderia cenocepacia TaxID=95486 RepID=UPI002ABE0B4A|nr:hypothetical protein [Burkholderia cenocepacia]
MKTTKNSRADALTDALERRLRVLIGTVNAYEKATGIGGWYAERIQEECNFLLKVAGSEVRFGLGYENPVEQPAAAPIESGTVSVACFSGSYPHGTITYSRLAPSPAAAPINSLPCPIVLDRTHVNQAFVTLGFDDPKTCDAFLKTARKLWEAPAPSPADERAALSDQDIYDKFSFLEGLVNESTYVQIADTAIEIARAASANETADERVAFEWPLLPLLPETVITTADGEAVFTAHQMQGYANAYGEMVRARAASANETGAKGADALAHEVWSAAQRAPGEGIEDAVQRIAAILSRSPAMAAEAVAIVDESDDGLFVEILYGANGSPLKCGDKLYAAPQPAQAAMPVLTNAMRAVITNESGAYQSADDLYAALCAAADDERPAQADARVGLTDEQRESVDHAATWLDRSEDLQNKAHAERLRALLQGANHAG